MKIKKGDSFVCIKNVVMNNDCKDIYYRKGYVYNSEINGYITNDKLNKGHGWSKSTEAKKYFVKLKNT
jgi:hypothetical protein